MPSTQTRFQFAPIGIVRSCFGEKAEAPRQPEPLSHPSVGEATARIELFDTTGMRDALEDISSFSHLWLIFVFDRDCHFRPKVTPPRSTRKRGVLGTRSPHRPNPIGLSLVELTRTDGLTLWITAVDVLDNTPVIDIKPYLPYADAPRSSPTSGWLDARDPQPQSVVTFDTVALQQCKFVAAQTGFDLETRIRQALALGATPHAYRRIRKDAQSYILSVKAWRARFHNENGAIFVFQVFSGYRSSELNRVHSETTDAELVAHRAFADHFGAPS